MSLAPYGLIFRQPVISKWLTLLLDTALVQFCRFSFGAPCFFFFLHFVKEKNWWTDNDAWKWRCTLCSFQGRTSKIKCRARGSAGQQLLCLERKRARRETGVGGVVLKRKERRKKEASAKMCSGEDWEEQRELFNFHSHSQMCWRQNVAFEELVAR